MQASDDEVDDDGVEGEDNGDKRQPQAKKGQSKRSLERSKGSKCVAAYDIPIPIEWKAVAGGFQKYKLVPDTRVWDRRTFTYDDAFKDGVVVQLQARPSPPHFFCDKYLGSCVFVERGCGSALLVCTR